MNLPGHRIAACLGKSGAEDARTPNADAWSDDSAASAKRLECVRFIGTFRLARHGQRFMVPIRAEKREGLPVNRVAQPSYVFSAMVGMARCAVPARVVAGGTNDRAALAFEGVAPLHAARTSQRDVPTTLNTYAARCRQHAQQIPSAVTRHPRVPNRIHVGWVISG